MSIFGNIMSAIFGRKAEAQTAPGTSTASPSTVPSAGQNVDVEAVLTEKAKQKQEKAGLAEVDRGPDEAPRPRQQP